jgi:hypothetical protein
MLAGTHARWSRARTASCACALLLACAPAPAFAYNYASPLAHGCHEAITIAALRALRAELDTHAARPSDADRAWIGDLPLDLPDDMRDLDAATLIAGVRDNDLKGRHGLDTAELAQVHGDPDLQHEHCLRRPEDDEPDGSAAALAECRAYVAAQAADAISFGLDASGAPDPTLRLALDVYLDFAGESRVRVPRAYLRLGRGLHALQDSFAHAVRSPDGLRVRALFNWVDFVEEQHVERRDGPIHREALDVCEDLDPLRRQRLELTIESSIAYLRAVLAPSESDAEKLAAVEAVLERYMSFEPGCSADNAFCDAPELAYAEPSIGCSAAPRASAGAGGSTASVVTSLLLGVVLVVRTRRRATRARSRGRTRDRGAARCALWLALAVLGMHAFPDAAAAHDDSARPATCTFALASKVGLSVDETAAAAAVGGRYCASAHWLLGIDAEWNPWASWETGRVRPGTFNGYATAAFRAPVTRTLALRVTGHAGVSTLLFDLHGAPAGSVGPYAGLSLLGLEIALGPEARLLLEPADVAVAMPHVTGIPLAHRQYRASVGLELWF